MKYYKEPSTTGGDDIYYKPNVGTDVINTVEGLVRTFRKFVCNGCIRNCELIVRGVDVHLPYRCPFDDRLVDWEEVI